MADLERKFHPSEDTIKAMEEARHGNLDSFNSVDELIADLNEIVDRMINARDSHGNPSTQR